jgi:hypothetical protein
MFIGINSIAYVLGLLGVFAAAADAVETPAAASGQTAGSVIEKLIEMEFPQSAQITGTDVNIRSGPGTSYYRCGKLKAGDTVTVVDVLHNAWAKIVPPEGSYSWISKTYVELNPSNPKVGVLTGDDVRVWAGSDFVEPLHSHSQQVKLYKGDLVELLGPADLDADYYKIKPPADAYLWLSMEYIKLLGPLSARKSEEAPAPDTAEEKSPAAAAPAPVAPAAPVAPTPPPAKTPAPAPEPPAEAKSEVKPAAPAPPTVESLALQKCQQLNADIEAQLKKALPEQNYAPIKEALNKLMETPDIGRAEIYAKSLLARIASYELAGRIQKDLKTQDQALQEARARIAAAQQAQREQSVPVEAKYLFVGTLRPSNVYTGQIGPKRYLIMDKNKRILCYLLTRDSSIQAQCDGLIGQIVGIKGTILDDPKAMIPVVLTSGVEAIFGSAPVRPATSPTFLEPPTQPAAEPVMYEIKIESEASKPQSDS